MVSINMQEGPASRWMQHRKPWIDQHLKGFRALRAVDIMHGAIVAKADELHGSHIFLDVVSVGATINIMMAASLAPGRTIFSWKMPQDRM